MRFRGLETEVHMALIHEVRSLVVPVGIIDSRLAHKSSHGSAVSRIRNRGQIAVLMVLFLFGLDTAKLSILNYPNSACCRLDEAIKCSRRGIRSSFREESLIGQRSSKTVPAMAEMGEQGSTPCRNIFWME